MLTVIKPNGVMQNVEADERARESVALETRRDDARRGSLERKRGIDFLQRRLAVDGTHEEGARTALHERIGVLRGVAAEQRGAGGHTEVAGPSDNETD